MGTATGGGGGGGGGAAATPLLPPRFGSLLGADVTETVVGAVSSTTKRASCARGGRFEADARLGERLRGAAHLRILLRGKLLRRRSGRLPRGGQASLQSASRGGGGDARKEQRDRERRQPRSLVSASSRSRFT